MLGKHHILLTLYTLLPFIVPLFFLSDKQPIIYAIVFLIAAIIGSLTPDADCGGKPTLYYKYQFIYYLMIPITKLIVLFFQKFKDLEYEVKEEHRGIMHSPIGILISSFLIVLVILIFLIIFGQFNIFFLAMAFFGLLTGQFLHLLEDTCTISGIKWGFPFKMGELNGNIYTNWADKTKIDIRPEKYANTLFIVFIILFLAHSFLYAYKKTLPSLWIVYLVLFMILFIIWLSFLYISGVFSKEKITPPQYLVDKTIIREQRKRSKQLFRSLSKPSWFGLTNQFKEPRMLNYKMPKFQEPKINLDLFPFQQKKRRKRRREGFF